MSNKKTKITTKKEAGKKRRIKVIDIVFISIIVVCIIAMAVAIINTKKHKNKSGVPTYSDYESNPDYHDDTDFPDVSGIT